MRRADPRRAADEAAGASTGGRGEPPAGRLRLIVILGALTAVAPLSIDMYLPALPRLARDLSAGTSTAQLTLTACVVGLAVGQAVAGPLSDAWGRRRPLLIGLAAYAAASLLCAAAPNVQTLIALRFVQGAAGAAGIVIARAIVRDRYDGIAAAKFFSTLMLVNGLAPVLAPVLGGQLLRVAPWRAVFVVLAVIGVALLLAALPGLEETLPPRRRSGGGVRTTLRTFGSLLADRAFVGYAAAFGLSFTAMFVYISGSPFVLQDVYGLSPQAFSVVFGVNALGIVTAGQIGGRLAGRVPLRRLLGVGLAVETAGAAGLVAAVLAGAGTPGVLPALFLVVAAQGLVMPNATALALAGRPPRVAGSASALIGVGQFTVGGAAAPLAGIAGPHTAVPMAVAMAAAALAAAVAAVAAEPRVASPNSPAVRSEE
ncbi:Bcr/CflA family drug resistance efflux transporter [Actinomadura rubrobrunea]|uniref:Bcr/CflA family drug resistance efflux transporter n=1 Tax=Actinomadura rubrobrunea TaxID=115335 RepID=A0A9W6PTJ3_9ACTN|nr:multidrug effflux MFS transporter [Actinomadura rubrobrunea]GLW64259.1 Bcr/CflA family drug resistance efflux transporter [Actinomadura rubrobrunea]